MRRFTLLLSTLAIVVASLTVQAQKQPDDIRFDRPNSKSSKVATIGSRLIADVSGYYATTGKWRPDSTVFKYSGAHGGDYESSGSYPDEMLSLYYDSAITY